MPTNQVQEISILCKTKTMPKLERRPIINVGEENLLDDLDKINRLSSPPYVYEAIVNPSTTTEVSPSSNTRAMKISKTAQIALISIELNKLAFLDIQSCIVEDARELIDELKVDMAADKTLANNIPFIPIGKWFTIKDANSLSLTS